MKRSGLKPKKHTVQVILLEPLTRHNVGLLHFFSQVLNSGVAKFEAVDFEGEPPKYPSLYTHLKGSCFINLGLI